MFHIKREKQTEGPVLKQNCIKIGNSGEEMEYLTFPSSSGKTQIHGGISKGDFSSMNLSFSRGDNPESVMENYGRIAKVLECGPEDMVASHQTHTTNIRKVTEADKGKGITVERDYENVDGLICNEPGIVLVTYFADCVPQK